MLSLRKSTKLAALILLCLPLAGCFRTPTAGIADASVVCRIWPNTMTYSKLDTQPTQDQIKAWNKDHRVICPTTTAP
ncbi:hypothetical protein IZ6_24870 [Terrihabitans soli]|uniref:Uncharacterized protein n=1 Tax=Terrihabitans soli TaxID=708113 RepID=A0A6S6QWY0_9HYPH|nr:hypothetical protein IZ6_24870 [Terrihabitans soli]